MKKFISIKEIAKILEETPNIKIYVTTVFRN